jgi:hypothetical protein
MRVYEGATLIIEEGAELLGAGWMRAGASNDGYVQQIGGLVILQDGRDSAKLGVGDSGGSDGYYTISGGTLTYAEGSLGNLLVGARGGKGTFTVVGTDPNILMKGLVVGDSEGASGTVEFQVTSDGVSPISVDSASVDELGDETTSALLVTAIDAPPKADILLVDVAEGGAIEGVFDTVNGNPAPEGAEVVLASNGLKNTYALTYIGGTGNDIVLVYQSSVTMPTIIWVADNLHYDFAAGLPADYGFVDLLRAQGYKVDYKGEFDPHVEGNDEIPVNPDWLYWRELDPNKIAELNAADLVIVARDPASSTYDDGNEPAEWNSITTPLIMQSAHIARSNKWGWLNSTGTTRSTETNAVVIDANHPIFDGVAIDPNTQMVEVLSGGWNVDWVSNVTDAGNGTVLATRPDGIVWIAEWEAGQEYFEGSGHVAGGPRMFFASGSGSSNPVGDGTYNLTDDGATMFLNAVKYMLPAMSPAPVHSYTFEDGTADDSVGDADGILMGDAFVDSGSLFLDGDGDWMDMSGDVIAMNTYPEVTIEAWFTPEAGGNTGFHMLAAFGEEGTGAATWAGYKYLFMTPARGDDVSRAAIQTYSMDDSPWDEETGVSDVVEHDDGLQHHFVCTVNATDLAFYIDGVLIGTAALDPGNEIAGIGTAVARLGKGVYPADPLWMGTIEEFNIYNVALTTDDVAANYAKGPVQ